jgi:hypothetical protein
MTSAPSPGLAERLEKWCDALNGLGMEPTAIRQAAALAQRSSDVEGLARVIAETRLPGPITGASVTSAHERKLLAQALSAYLLGASHD